jgi:hypothetical protein
MTKKRALIDAVNDQWVKKPPMPTAKKRPKRNLHPVVKILVSLILGFAGGLMVGL